LVRAKYCLPSEIIASEPNSEIGAALERETGVLTTASNSSAAQSAEIIVLGVKPTVILPVLREIAFRVENKLVISLAAGTRMTAMEFAVRARFMRVLTNTPSAIGQAATGFARGSRTTDQDATIVQSMFNAIGLAVEVTEEQIDAVTALSGSGPAFVYTVIQALAEGGKRCGLPPEAAMKLAAQTVVGAAQLAIDTGKSPEELIRMVVTPGGTTAAGLAEMEKLGTAKGLMAAVEAATKRGQAMAREAG
jgi:pyrroline-5-carboxylate reductase